MPMNKIIILSPPSRVCWATIFRPPFQGLKVMTMSQGVALGFIS